jgi:hypothetical protein
MFPAASNDFSVHQILLCVKRFFVKLPSSHVTVALAITFGV